MERFNLKHSTSGAVTHFPARLKPETAAVILGFEKDDITTLVKHKLLKPLGKPKQNAVKYFTFDDIMEKASDRKWLERATQAIYDHWHGKFLRKTRAVGEGVEPALPCDPTSPGEVEAESFAE